MEISAAAVKSLREKTNLPLMQVKKALQEADGDEDRAIQILKDQVGSVIAKRSDNATEEGRIFVAVADDGSRAAMVEVQCESAPVAGGEDFKKFGEALVNQLLNGPGADSVEALLSQSASDGSSLKEHFESIVNKIREKFVVARVARVDGPVGSYVHHDGKTAVLFQADGSGDRGVLRDVGMHIAAIKPVVVHVEQLDPTIVQAERDRLKEEARATGKPDNIIEKIVDGKLKVFYKDEAGVLVEQPFAKDDSKTVSQVLAEAGFKAKAFTLWVLGSN